MFTISLLYLAYRKLVSTCTRKKSLWENPVGTVGTVGTRLGCFYVTAILSWGYGWGWYWGWGYLNLRMKWGWDEIESKFSWNWVEVELSWNWDKLTLNKGRNWAFIGVGLSFKICFRSTYVAEQLLFSMLLLISSY